MAQWEEGYQFLENVPVDMVGGGFDWHEHKERFRARQKGEDVDNGGVDSRNVPFADLPIKLVSQMLVNQL